MEHPAVEDSARLLIEQRGAVLLLTLSNPALRNALGPGVYAEGIAAIERAANDAGIGAVVLAGEGGDFCAGGNLRRLAANRARPPDVQAASNERLHEWVRRLRGCPKPIVAAVEGAAAGAGFSLALACDLIVAAREARFAMGYVRVGLSPDGGASAFLSSMLPRQLAAELLLAGEAIDAPRLHALGIVNRLCAGGMALAEALALAERLARGPRRATARIKRLLEAAPGNDLARQLELEKNLFVESLFDAECGEGIAAFLERRAPSFGGQR
jgi:enoyl-CoA hydratase/carnithine racemase